MIKKLNSPVQKRSNSPTKILRQLLSNYLAKPSDCLAEELVSTSISNALKSFVVVKDLEFSISLGKKQYNKLTEDEILSFYLSNSEHHLWKNFFYNTIEALRRFVNCENIDSDKHRELLMNFTAQSINFYEELLVKYDAVVAPAHLSDAYFWPKDSFDVTDILCVDETNFVFTSGKRKTILRSAQRHFLALGDLFRYKASLSELSSTNKIAKMWYFKAVQANMLNGRAFNQLGVLAAQSRNYLNVMFYYSMALSSKHPFGSSRESLELICNQIHQILSIDVTDSEAVGNGVRKEFLRCLNDSQCDEVWILPNKPILEKVVSIPKLNNCTFQDSKEQKRALLTLLHVAGILISNIGMEDFNKYRKIALKNLEILIRMKNSIVNSTSLLKIALIFVFANTHVKSGVSEISGKIQREHALRIIVDIFWIALNIIVESVENVDKSLQSDNIFVFKRVLPTFCVLNQWLLSPPSYTVNLLADKPVAYFLIEENGANVFILYASLLNKIQSLRVDNKIEQVYLNAQENSIDTSVYLPEFVIASFIHDVFKYPAPIFHFSMQKTNLMRNKEILTLHCRLNAILLSVINSAVSDNEKIVNHFNFLRKVHNYDINTTEYVFMGDYCEHKKTVNAISTMENGRDFNEQQCQMSEDDEILKKRLIYEENFAHNRKFLIEIYPKYLIPDTNSFIDHLNGIVKIVESKLFTVLVPTTVVAELKSLSKDMAGRKAIGILPQKLITTLSPGLGAKSKERNVQMQFVIQQATVTLNYLREAAEKRIINLATITSSGNILPHISFAHEMSEKDVMVILGTRRFSRSPTRDKRQLQTNDDRILASCIALNSIIDGPQNILTSQKNILKRFVVFLTEDRTLIIKAAAAKIPVRNVPSFIEWSAL